MTNRLVARLDNVGDVLLAGPAVRAIAHSGDPVTFVAGHSGVAAARLLPGVGRVVQFDAAWVSDDSLPVDAGACATFVAAISDAEIDEAIILTSFHQSPLPLALLLRLAGVPRIGATCVDFAGELLDVRHPYDHRLHEVEQALSLAAAMGHSLPPGDDGGLAVELPPPGRVADDVRRGGSYVVVHPGSSVPARGLPDSCGQELVAALAGAGWRVVLTGSRHEAPTCDRWADGTEGAVSLAGRTALGELGHVVAGASVVVCGNTGIAHLAAAVGTPVVQAFAPVVAAHRWRPWQVAHRTIGNLDIGCAGCRARRCPLEGQPCLAPFTVSAVVEAVEALVEYEVTV